MVFILVFFVSLDLEVPLYPSPVILCHSWYGLSLPVRPPVHTWVKLSCILFQSPGHSVPSMLCLPASILHLFMCWTVSGRFWHSASKVQFPALVKWQYLLFLWNHTEANNTPVAIISLELMVKHMFSSY